LNSVLVAAISFGLITISLVKGPIVHGLFGLSSTRWRCTQLAAERRFIRRSDQIKESMRTALGGSTADHEAKLARRGTG
jgi:hypothetical protein